MSEERKPVWGASRRQDNQLVSDDRVLCVIPKNKSSEQRVVAKSHQTRKTKISSRFIDVREWWFKHGPLEPPIATGKGTMIHREHVPKLIIALLSEMDPEELSRDEIEALKTQIARVERGRQP